MHLYNNLKIRSKILILTFIIILLSNIGAIFAYNYISKVLINKTMDSDKIAVNSAAASMTRFFSELDKSAFVLCTNRDLQSYLSQDQDNYQLLKLRTSILQNMAQFTIPKPYISLHAFSNFTSPPIIDRSLTTWINPDYNFRTDQWYRQLQTSKDNKIKTVNDNQMYYSQRERMDVVTCAYKVLSIDGLETIGFLLIDVEKSYLETIFAEHLQKGTQIHIQNENQETIINLGNDYSEDLKKHSGNYIVTTVTDNNNHWEYVSVTPSDNVLSQINYIFMIFIVILTVSIAVSLILAITVSKSITIPIEHLIVDMKHSRKGHLQMHLPRTTNDEFGQLLLTYNDMMSEINLLLKNNETMEVLKKEADLNALSSQINPHFIYNTLEMLISLSLEGDRQTVISICKALGKMLRYNLNTPKQVKFSQELSHIKYYINIIEKRFIGRFETIYDIADNVLNLSIPKFILQPFVENAVLHGFADVMTGGILTISASIVHEKVLEIRIHDNGKGMDQESVKKFTSLIYEDSPGNDKKIGILNVFKRLQLEYGSSSYNIKSRIGSGTTIILQLPICSPDFSNNNCDER